MSFELLDITSFVIAFVMIAGLTVLLAVGATAEYFAGNRKVRVARQESIPAYYGHLLGAH